MDVDDRLRIVQWATGNIGTRSLRSVMEHPGMSLAGVRVYSGDKVGRDAGELCGLEPVGVAATGDVDDILALDADCVLYMPRACDFDERRLGHLRGSFGPSLQVVADALSLPLDSVEVRGEVATAPRTLEIAAGTVPAGTNAAQRITVSGVRDGAELLRFRSAPASSSPSSWPGWAREAVR